MPWRLGNIDGHADCDTAIIHYFMSLMMLTLECLSHRSVNVPARLLDSLDLHRLEHEAEALLIHLSTDQVYDGSKPCWKETDRCKPVNVYGLTKREAELLIQVRWTNNKAVYAHASDLSL